MHKLTIVAVALLALVMKTLHDANFFTILVPHSAGVCSILPTSTSFRGVEDIHSSGDGSFFVATSDDRHLWMNSAGNFAGNEIEAVRISKMRSTNDDLQGKLLLGVGSIVSNLKLIYYPWADFHPHGIYLLEIPDSLPRVFVVNHRSSSDGKKNIESVSIFDLDLDQQTARYVRDITDKNFRSINDVVVSGTEMWVSNWRFYKPEKFFHMVEIYLQRSWGYVVRCDLNRSGECTIAIPPGQVAMANGLMLKNDKLFVAGSVGKNVLEFVIDEDRNAKLSRTFALDLLPDNLSLAPNNLLVVAGHPKGLAFQAHAKNPHNVPCPCSVKTIDLKTGETETIHTSEGGDPISACTVGVLMGDELLMGSVYDSGIAVCTGYKK